MNSGDGDIKILPWAEILKDPTKQTIWFVKRKRLGIKKCKTHTFMSLYKSSFLSCRTRYRSWNLFPNSSLEEPSLNLSCSPLMKSFSLSVTNTEEHTENILSHSINYLWDTEHTNCRYTVALHQCGPYCAKCHTFLKCLKLKSPLKHISSLTHLRV